MSFKKSLLCAFGLLAVIAGAQEGFAKKTTYVYSDRRFNFVKREEMDKSEVRELKPHHPYVFNEPQMRYVLQHIKLSKRLVLSKEAYSQEVFDEKALQFLTPKLIDAFHDATSNERIVVSYLDKNPQVILRNDRITIMELWVSGEELHVHFSKLTAKLVGDTDKRGTTTRIVNESKGIHVSLETDATQGLGDSTDELIIYLAKAFAELNAQSKVNIMNAPAATAAPATVQSEQPTVKLSPEDAERRLKKLNKLKKKKLITDEEYQEKRQEILNSL